MNKRRLAIIENYIKRKYQTKVSRNTFKWLIGRLFGVITVGCFLYIIFTGKSEGILNTILDTLQVGIFSSVMLSWIITVLRDVAQNYTHKHLESEHSYLEFEKEELERMINSGKITKEEYSIYFMLRSKYNETRRYE